MQRLENRLEEPRPSGSEGTGLRDPFDAIPVAAPNVEARGDTGAPVQLRLDVTATRGVGAWLARRLGLRRYARVNLDDRGSLCWSLMDGTRTLGEIERAVRQRYSLREHESRKAMTLFAKALMKRRLIWLKITASGTGAANGDGE